MTYDKALAIVAEQLPGMQVSCLASISGFLYIESEHYEKTEQDHKNEAERQNTFHREQCSCKGRRWHPSDDGWLLLEEMANKGYSNALLMVRGAERIVHLTKPGIDGTTKAGKGESFQHAVFIAAANALQEEK